MPRARSTSGFTLIEVVIAMFILAGVLLMMGTSGQKYLSSTTRDRQRVQAAAAAEAQIALIRVEPAYNQLTARFNGVANNTPFTGWTRTTQVVRSGAGTMADITRITVTVNGPGVGTPITRTLTVATP